MPSDEDSLWLGKTLAELSEKPQYGINAKASESADGPKFLRITDIVPDSIDWRSVPHSDVSADDFVKYRLQPGDLVIARSGSVGYAKQISESDPAAVFASYLVRFRALPAVDEDFLAAIVCSEGYRSWVLKNATGVAQPNANPQILGSFPIRVPPLPVQKRIGILATTLNRLIDCNRRRIELLEETARLLYQEWFVHFRYPGHEDVLLVDSELGPIPIDFKVKSLNEVCEINRKSVRQGELSGEILYVDISSVGHRTMDPPEPINFNDAPGRARRVVADGDTIWSTVRPNRRSHVLLIDPPRNLICSTGFAVLSPTTVPSSFLHELSSHESFTAHLEGRATGSAYPAVRPEDFECYRFALPNPTLLETFDELIGSLHQLQAKLGQENETLKRTRDLLLPRLVSGELDISGLDLDLKAVS